MKRIIRLVLIPLLFGLSVMLIVNMMAPGPPPQVEPEPMVAVVVAARDITARTEITADAVKVEQMPASVVPDGVVKDFNDVYGAISIVPVYSGEMLIRSKLAMEDSVSDLSYRLPPNMKAITIGVNEIVGVAGHVSPGDRVDVIWTGQCEYELPVTGFVASDVLVLAVKQNTDSFDRDQIDMREYTSVTLAVGDEQALKLTLADETGRLRLALRSVLAGHDRSAGRVASEQLLYDSVLSPYRQQVAAHVTMYAVNGDVREVTGVNTDSLTVTRRNGDVFSQLQQMHENDEAILVDSADLIGTSGNVIGYQLATGSKGDDESVGIWLDMKVINYDDPHFDVDIDVVTRPGNQDAPLLRTARSTVQKTVDDVLIITGLELNGVVTVTELDQVSKDDEIVIVIKLAHDPL